MVASLVVATSERYVAGRWAVLGDQALEDLLRKGGPPSESHPYLSVFNIPSCAWDWARPSGEGTRER